MYIHRMLSVCESGSSLLSLRAILRFTPTASNLALEEAEASGVGVNVRMWSQEADPGAQRCVLLLYTLGEDVEGMTNECMRKCKTKQQ
jgi:hypothetical protein